MPRYSLDNVTINGFRGLKDLRLEGLGLINVLVGPNNCGKTSVLEALSILCNAFEPFEWVSMVRRRDFGRLDETRIQSLRWCFPQECAVRRSRIDVRRRMQDDLRREAPTAEAPCDPQRNRWRSRSPADSTSQERSCDRREGG